MDPLCLEELFCPSDQDSINHLCVERAPILTLPAVTCYLHHTLKAPCSDCTTYLLLRTSSQASKISELGCKKAACITQYSLRQFLWSSQYEEYKFTPYVTGRLELFILTLRYLMWVLLVLQHRNICINIAEPYLRQI